MTELLAQAVAEAQKLPAEKQDDLARRILIELTDPGEVEREFEKNQELLASRGEEALVAHRASHLKDKDPKKR